MLADVGSGSMGFGGRPACSPITVKLLTTAGGPEQWGISRHGTSTSPGGWRGQDFAAKDIGRRAEFMGRALSGNSRKKA